MAFNKGKYDQEYNRAHITRKFIPFNDMNSDDAEMLIWLSTKDNVTKYIKGLIKEDLEYQKGRNLAEIRRIRCQNGCQNGNETHGNVDK